MEATKDEKKEPRLWLEAEPQKKFDSTYLRAIDVLYLRWAVECLGNIAYGKEVRMNGKHGPD